MLFTSSLKTLHVINCTELCDKIWACVQRESCGFTIPMDFCIEFRNSTFPPVLEFTEGIFELLLRDLSNGANPRCVAKVIQVFLAANSTWTYYSDLRPVSLYTPSTLAAQSLIPITLFRES